MTPWLVIVILLLVGLAIFLYSKNKKAQREIDEYKRVEQTLDKFFVEQGRLRDLFKGNTEHMKNKLKSIRSNIKEKEDKLDTNIGDDMTFDNAVDILDGI